MSKGTKSIAFYLMMILIFGSLMYFIAKEGESQQLENSIASIQNAPSNLEEGFTIFTQLLVHNIESSIGILLLQIITILLTCRLFGWLFQKIGQPTVIGEIVAGIVLGPSVLGNLFPEASAFLFPVESLVNINMLSQFGLILFMFAIGMELNISEVRKKLKETILISHTSTIVPFFFGMLTAYFVYDKYADKSTPFLSFALFIGIAMSITAFPVLARIIQEKGLTKTHLYHLVGKRGEWGYHRMVLASGCHSDRTSGFDAKCRLQHLILSSLHCVYVFGGAAIPADDRTYLPQQGGNRQGAGRFHLLAIDHLGLSDRDIGIACLIRRFYRRSGDAGKCQIPQDHDRESRGCIPCAISSLILRIHRITYGNRSSKQA